MSDDKLQVLSSSVSQQQEELINNTRISAMLDHDNQLTPLAISKLAKIDCNIQLHTQLEGHGNKVYCCDWNPVNTNEFLSCGRDGRLIFWNADMGCKTMMYNLDTEFMMCARYSPDALFVTCAGLDNVLFLYKVYQQFGLRKDVQPIAILKDHNGKNLNIYFTFL
jgi:WD40 repeat protein